MSKRIRSRSPSPAPGPSTPKPIRRLQESLINRIAAGEIIHRPASALKELIENCLDAGSTSIKITVKDGGMKLLQIQDNGCGIRKADLPILAERFTTSKLSTFSDLSHLTTYGFRGEALASMSHVAHLSVVTKTKEDACAWKGYYADGKLTPAKAGLTSDAKPCAGNDGTTITIEDLFYNTPTRLSALRSFSDEYARILDVITKYAVHNPGVAFLCKKAGSPSPDISTPSLSDTTQAIRLLYGTSIGKELLHKGVSSIKKLKKRPSRLNQKQQDEDADADADADAATDDDDAESWTAEAQFTSANYQSKKMVFLLFINHRLVESSRIKKALDAVYSGVLPKGAYPFIYLSLHIDPRSVDVNVHPTKREVHFLNEDEITEQVCDALQSVLVEKNQSRAFEYQTLLTGGIMDDGSSRKVTTARLKDREVSLGEDGPTEGSPSSAVEVKKKILSQHKVRISMQDRTLDSMFPIVNPAQIHADTSTTSNFHNESDVSQTINTSKPREIKESDCYLTSIRELRQAVLKGKHTHLTEILEKHVFVGIVDLDRSLSLLQHSTKLYLINYGALAEELFYQLGLRQFGNFHRLKLEPPPPLRTMVKLAVDAEESTERSSLSKSQIAECIVGIIMEKREMLVEYFSIQISVDGLVESLPLLLKDYIPNLDKLPSFLMRIGPQVVWTSEAPCFDSMLRELAYFYAPGPALSSSKAATEEKAERWQIQHVLFPNLRKYVAAPKSLLDRDVVQVASLPDLYRVFERC